MSNNVNSIYSEIDILDAIKSSKYWILTSALQKNAKLTISAYNKFELSALTLLTKWNDANSHDKFQP